MQDSPQFFLAFLILVSRRSTLKVSIFLRANLCFFANRLNLLSLSLIHSFLSTQLSNDHQMIASRVMSKHTSIAEYLNTAHKIQINCLASRQ